MRILVTGHDGQVARALAARVTDRFAVEARGRPDLDITDRASVSRALDQSCPDIVVNAAAYTAVDQAESDGETAFAVNCAGAENVAVAAAEAGLPIIHISTDYVFSGDKPEPYTEEDAEAPQGVYALSKFRGEQRVAAANSRHVILRTAWVYSPHGRNFAKTMLRLAGERDTVSVVDDQTGTPTHADDIACGVFAVARAVAEAPVGTNWRGTFHMTASGATTWAGFAQALFAASAARGGPSADVQPIRTSDYPTAAKRPANSRLDTSRFRATFGCVLPDWRGGVERFADVAIGPLRG